MYTLNHAHVCIPHRSSDKSCYQSGQAGSDTCPLLVPCPVLASADPFETLSSFWTYFFFACPIIDRLKLRHQAETAASSSALPLRIMMANAGATAVQTGSEEAPAFLYRWDNIPACPAGEEHLAAAHGRELWDIFGLTENLPPNQSNNSCNSSAVRGWVGWRGGWRRKGVFSLEVKITARKGL